MPLLCLSRVRRSLLYLRCASGLVFTKKRKKRVLFHHDPDQFLYIQMKFLDNPSSSFFWYMWYCTIVHALVPSSNPVSLTHDIDYTWQAYDLRVIFHKFKLLCLLKLPWWVQLNCMLDFFQPICFMYSYMCIHTFLFCLWSSNLYASLFW
jgi:hypothetical protein